MRKTCLLLVISFIIVNILSSCNSTKEASTLPNQKITDLPEGLRNVQGFLIVSDPTSFLPADDDAIYLIKLKNEDLEDVRSVSPENRDTIQAIVDESTGKFNFSNVLPGNYLVMVRTIGGSYIPARYYSENPEYAVITVDEKIQHTNIELQPLVIP